MNKKQMWWDSNIHHDLPYKS